MKKHTETPPMRTIYLNVAQCYSLSLLCESAQHDETTDLAYHKHLQRIKDALGPVDKRWS